LKFVPSDCNALVPTAEAALPPEEVPVLLVKAVEAAAASAAALSVNGAVIVVPIAKFLRR
jgi:hypothetical protein